MAWLPRYAADADPNLRYLPAPDAPAARDVWLGVHRDVRDTPRISEVFQSLTLALKEQARRLDGRTAGAHPFLDGPLPEVRDPAPLAGEGIALRAPSN
jgi:hypothetical protein